VLEIMLVGDTHEDRVFIKKCIRIAAQNNITYLIQLGDFGMWIEADGSLNVAFLMEIALYAMKYGVIIIFIDGNHDFHAGARALYSADADGLREIHPNLIWADRGAVFTVEGVTFGALGGAVSHDRDQRKIHFDTEMTTQDDLQTLLTRQEAYGKTIDVLLTHEAPSSVVVPGVSLLGGSVGRDIAENRDILSEAVSALLPRYVLHGHHHHYYTAIIDRGSTLVRVYGYASNIQDDKTSYGIFTIEELRSGYRSVFAT
jgi:Icc-related predicted phosphoesterase